MELTNFIGGEYVTPKACDRSPLIDPSTGDQYADAPVSGRHQQFSTWVEVTNSGEHLD